MALRPRAGCDGLDHFALPDDTLELAHAEGRLRRNFQGYTTDPSDPLLGFGTSAIERLPQRYVLNASALRAYAERIARGDLAIAKGHVLTRDDRLRADLIERIMGEFSVEVGRVCRSHGGDSGALMALLPRLTTFMADGLVRFDGETLCIREDARAFVRTVAAALDEQLGTSAAVHGRPA